MKEAKASLEFVPTLTDKHQSSSSQAGVVCWNQINKSESSKSRNHP